MVRPGLLHQLEAAWLGSEMSHATLTRLRQEMPQSQPSTQLWLSEWESYIHRLGVYVLEHVCKYMCAYMYCMSYTNSSLCPHVSVIVSVYQCLWLYVYTVVHE